MLSQISLPHSLPAEAWAAITALLTGAVFLAKKFLVRKPAAKPDYIARAEFHAGIDSLRDRIAASHLALADKIELQHNHVLTVLDRQGTTFERRLDQLESNLARLDERTSL